MLHSLRNGSIYTNTARFDTGRALDNDDLRRLAPSIFAETAHDSRSQRFQPIPTIRLLDSLREEGFVPVGARQSIARADDRKDYTKHLIRLRHVRDMEGRKAGDTVTEIMLKNANDGSAAYDLMAGMFRIQCLNSLVCQTGTIDSVKVRHTGTPEKVRDMVIEGTYRVLDECKMLAEKPAEWQAKQLTRDHRVAFAEAAHVLRFGDAEGNVATPIQPAQLLNARRYADQGDDLWRTFNVVQENVIRGGLRGWGRDANNRPRRVSTREVKGIDQEVKLNKALWILAERLAQAA